MPQQSSIGQTIFNFAQVFVQLQQQRAMMERQRQADIESRKRWEREMAFRQESFEWRKKMAEQEYALKEEQFGLREVALEQQKAEFQEEEKRRGLGVVLGAINRAYDNEISHLKSLLAQKGKGGKSLSEALMEYTQTGKVSQKDRPEDPIDQQIREVSGRLQLYQEQHTALLTQAAQAQGLTLDKRLFQELSKSALTYKPEELGQSTEMTGAESPLSPGESTDVMEQQNQKVETLRTLLSEKSHELVQIGQRLQAAQDEVAAATAGTPEHAAAQAKYIMLHERASELDRTVRQLDNQVRTATGEQEILQRGKRKVEETAAEGGFWSDITTGPFE